MEKHLILDSQLQTFTEREGQLAPGLFEFKPFVLTSNGYSTVTDNGDGTYTDDESGLIYPSKTGWYLTSDYPFVPIVITGTTEIEIYGETYPAKLANYTDNTFCGYVVKMYSDDWGYRLFVDQSGSFYEQGTVDEINVIDSFNIETNDVFSVKPGVAYTQDNNGVHYNRPKGYYLTVVYITKENTLTPLFGGRGIEEIFSIQAEGTDLKKSSLTPVKYDEEREEIRYYGYTFKNPGLNAVTYGFRDKKIVTESLFGRFPDSDYGCPFTIFSVYFEDGITELPDNMFNSAMVCYARLPNTLTAIPDFCFGGSFIQNIEIPDTVTTIDWRAFSGSRITGITGGDNVTFVERYAFENTPWLNTCPVYGNIKYVLPTIAYTATSQDMTTYELKSGTTCICAGCFSACTAMTSLNIPNTVKNIGYVAFMKCTSLTSLTIPDSVQGELRFSTYWGEGGIFTGDYNLRQVTIGSGVTKLGGATFSACTNLSAITCNAQVAPAIEQSTFRSVKSGGVLRHPSGSDYSTWMNSSAYRLGYYGWTEETF